MHYPSSGTLFQFHKGTIRTTPNGADISRVATFQFHKGTIRTIVGEICMPSFHEFQFHKGTIRTHLIMSR